MKSYTYQTLEAALIAYNRDYDSEFAAEIPSLIAEGEARVYGDLELDMLSEEATVALPPTSVDVTLPANTIAAQEVRYGGQLVRERTLAFVNQMITEYPAGNPAWWASLTQRQIRVGPNRPVGADPADTLALRVYAPEEALDPGTPGSTTWVSTVFGSLLLQSCLWGVELFNKHAAGAELRANDYGLWLARAHKYMAGKRRTTTRV